MSKCRVLPRYRVVLAVVCVGIAFFAAAAATLASHAAGNESLSATEQALEITAENVAVTDAVLGACRSLRFEGLVHATGSTVEIKGCRSLDVQWTTSFDPASSHAEANLSGRVDDVAVTGAGPQDLSDLGGAPPGYIWIAQGGRLSLGDIQHGWIWVTNLSFDQASARWTDDGSLVATDAKGKPVVAYAVTATLVQRDRGKLQLTVKLHPLRCICFTTLVLQAKATPVADGFHLSGSTSMIG